MNIIKKFALWVLREDWEIASARIRTLQNDLRERNEKIDDLKHQLNDWTIKTHLNESSILPQSAVKSEIETYYWDFNFSNIKIISDDVFDLISQSLL